MGHLSRFLLVIFGYGDKAIDAIQDDEYAVASDFSGGG